MSATLRDQQASSAAVGSRSTSAMSSSGATDEPVRALQHVLYRAVKADPGRRFHALRDKIYRRDVLWRAWAAVRRNNGAPGVDAITVAMVEEYGIARLLDEVAIELREQTYRSLPARRVWIPKPGQGGQRPLSIPAVRDRVVQAAVKIVLEPIFEADMLECSFGFRPRRSPHDALQVLVEESARGRRWVVETNIAECFTAIPHDMLIDTVAERVSDRSVLQLLRTMLRAGAMQQGAVRREVAGTPQGGVVSPLLCNVFLNRQDRSWVPREHGVLVRFADDLLVMCKSRQQAEAALERLRDLLGELGLAPKESKTRIVELAVGGEGFDFLGFHHRLVRSRARDGQRRAVFMAQWPSDRATQRAGDRVRTMTSRTWLRFPIEVIVREINEFLRGWTGYFRFGHSAERFSKLRQYIRMRLALFISHKHRRSRHFGVRALLNQTPNEYGLFRLYGIVVSPRAGKPWREKPNAGGERRR